MLPPGPRCSMREIAATRLAETEIVADDQVAHRQPSHQHTLDEILGGERREIAH